jgi:hypothetical protein
MTPISSTTCSGMASLNPGQAGSWVIGHSSGRLRAQQIARPRVVPDHAGLQQLAGTLGVN